MKLTPGQLTEIRKKFWKIDPDLLALVDCIKVGKHKGDAQAAEIARLGKLNEDFDALMKMHERLIDDYNVANKERRERAAEIARLEKELEAYKPKPGYDVGDYYEDDEPAQGEEDK